MSDIGDYYERKRVEHHEAWLKWLETIKAFEENPNQETAQAKYEAYEAMVDAGNTGD